MEGRPVKVDVCTAFLLHLLQHIKGCGVMDGELIVRPLVATYHLVLCSNGLAKLFEELPKGYLLQDLIGDGLSEGV